MTKEELTKIFLILSDQLKWASEQDKANQRNTIYSVNRDLRDLLEHLT